MKLPLPALLLAQKAVDAVLHLDPDTQARLSVLEGKRIRVNVLMPSLSVSLLVENGQVVLESSVDFEDNPTATDLTLSGTASDLRSLLDGNDAVYTGAVKMEGDIGVSQELKKIMAQLDPDWQESVSAYLGDSVTHRLDVTQAGFMKWFKRTRDALRQNTGEYLQEEAELLAPDPCIAAFCEEVDEVRAATDRLEARIQQLEERATRNPDSSASC